MYTPSIWITDLLYKRQKKQAIEYEGEKIQKGVAHKKIEGNISRM